MSTEYPLWKRLGLIGGFVQMLTSNVCPTPMGFGEKLRKARGSTVVSGVALEGKDPVAPEPVSVGMPPIMTELCADSAFVVTTKGNDNNNIETLRKVRKIDFTDFLFIFLKNASFI
jgi:hypothetical protein